MGKNLLSKHQGVEHLCVQLMLIISTYIYELIMTSKFTVKVSDTLNARI